MYYNWKYKFNHNSDKFEFELAKTINNNIIDITMNRNPFDQITVIDPLDTQEKFEKECNKWIMNKVL